MLTEKEAIEIFEWCGALNRDGHFAYTSGKHGKEYVNKDAVYPHTELISKLCESIAEQFQQEDIEAVLGPALGGIILSQWTAFHLMKLSGEEVFATYAEKNDGNFVLRRGYDELIRGKRVLVVEDVLTTGGSVQKIVALAKEHGADVMGVGALVNRGGVTSKDIDAKLFALINLAFESWDPNACPLCLKKVPLNPSLGKTRCVK